MQTVQSPEDARAGTSLLRQALRPAVTASFLPLIIYERGCQHPGEEVPMCPVSTCFPSLCPRPACLAAALSSPEGCWLLLRAAAGHGHADHPSTPALGSAGSVAEKGPELVCSAPLQRWPGPELQKERPTNKRLPALDGASRVLTFH